jgi:hypothetical protein
MTEVSRKESKKVHVQEQDNTGKISKRLSEFLAKLKGSIAEDTTDSETWRTKQTISINQRLGIKKYSEDPYPGAPDIPLPETDKIIKQSTPPLVLSSWNAKTLALVKIAETVDPAPHLEKRRKAEKALNWVLRHKNTNLFKKLWLAADNMKQYGHCLFRTYEDFKSTIVHKVINRDDFTKEQLDMFKTMPIEDKKAFFADQYELDLEDDEATISNILEAYKNGDDTIEFDIERVSTLPNVEIPIPTKVIVPTYTTDINIAERIKYRINMTRHEIEEEMDNGRFRTIDLDEALGDGNTDPNVDTDIVETTKENNSDTSDNSATTDLFNIDIIETWYKPSDDARYQRWVFVMLSNVFAPEKSLLQSIPFPYDFGDMWDMDKCDNEIKDPRYHDSRGEPEMCRALQEVMDRSVSNMLIRDEFNNTPMWEVQDNSEIMDAHITFTPGQKIPVQTLGQEINQLNQQPIPDTSSQQILTLAKTFIEEYRGSNDRFFRNAANPTGDSTLGETKLGIQQGSGPASVEIINWNKTLDNVYFKMYTILKDRFDDSIFIDGEEITKEDFNFPAEVVSNGNIEVADKEKSKQLAVNRLQVVTMMMQQGVADANDLFNAYQDWLDKDGVIRLEDYSTSPEEIMQTKLAQMMQQLQQMQQQFQSGQEQIDKDQKAIARNQAKMKKDRNVLEGETSVKIAEGDDNVKVTRTQTKTIPSA